MWISITHISLVPHFIYYLKFDVKLSIYAVRHLNKHSINYGTGLETNGKT